MSRIKISTGVGSLGWKEFERALTEWAKEQGYKIELKEKKNGNNKQATETTQD